MPGHAGAPEARRGGRSFCQSLSEVPTRMLAADPHVVLLSLGTGAASTSCPRPAPEGVGHRDLRTRISRGSLPTRPPPHFFPSDFSRSDSAAPGLRGWGRGSHPGGHGPRGQDAFLPR